MAPVWACLLATPIFSLALMGGSEAEGQAPWDEWLANFGHDSYAYPPWVSEQAGRCSCSRPRPSEAAQCRDGSSAVDWRAAADLTWCAARHFLLSHMPEFDLHFLPGSVSVEGGSMLDDNIAFALMAWNISLLDPRPPLQVALPYLLPYAAYHEARVNWRPLFFAKYVSLAATGRGTSRGVLGALIGGDMPVMDWAAHVWPSYAGTAAGNRYQLGPFASGTAPPVVGPFDFAAYGYASCTGWATFLVSALRAVGVPARQVGAPCWNTGQFAGLATANPQVSACWSGGPRHGLHGGSYLNNHNWVEYWDNTAHSWRFVDVATSSLSEETWFCANFSAGGGCSCASQAGKAGKDHEILAATWSPVGGDAQFDGGPVLDVATDLRLSSGEAVSPLPWSPRLTSPLGSPLKDIGLRVVDRTAFYRCASREPS